MIRKNLNALIRKNEGSVKLDLATAHGAVRVGLVKSELMAGLADIHPDNKAETGLTIVDGVLVHEADLDRLAARGVRESALEGADEEQLDLLDGPNEATWQGDANAVDAEDDDLDDLLA